MDDNTPLFATIPGATEVLDWFGFVPTFHDAEVVGLDLRRRAPSTLSVYCRRVRSETDDRGHFVLDRHAVVTFLITDIIDIQLEGFSPQNVLWGLVVRRAPDRQDRRNFYAFDPSPEDYELELEPSYGLGGRIRCRTLSMELVPGKPSDSGA